VEASPPVAAPAIRSRRTSSDHVADALRAAINSGHLADGEELNQVELAEHFGVSRVPVREAIRRLEAEGLIEAAAHRRAVVRGFDLAGIAESFELRALIEGHLVEAAVPLLTRRHFNELTELNAAMRTAAEADDDRRFLALDASFHHRLYEPAGRPTALEISTQLRSRAERYVLLRSDSFVGEQARWLTRDHATIVRIARSGDATAARHAIERHLGRLCDAILRLSRRRPTAHPPRVQSMAPPQR
jgi:DNA-binding GntR family transcriptional regulator